MFTYVDDAYLVGLDRRQRLVLLHVIRSRLAHIVCTGGTEEMMGEYNGKLVIHRDGVTCRK